MEKKDKRTRRKFSAEYKQRTVDRVLKQGQSTAQVARDLGVYESSLGKWVKQTKVDQGKGPAGALTSEELAELRQLRKEVKILREEREILKKRRPSSPRKRDEVSLHRGGEGQAFSSKALSLAQRFSERLLRSAQA